MPFAGLCLENFFAVTGDTQLLVPATQMRVFGF